MKQIMDATGGKGVDVIVEMLADANLGNDLEILAKNARVVVSHTITLESLLHLYEVIISQRSTLCE